MDETNTSHTHLFINNAVLENMPIDMQRAHTPLNFLKRRIFNLRSAMLSTTTEINAKSAPNQPL
jgi:hypothetical protein